MTGQSAGGTRFAADPGDGRAACGTARAARKSERNRGKTRNDFSTDTAAREPPAHAAHDRPGAGRRAKSGAGGSRAKLRECSPLTEALLCLPQAAKASAPSARGFAGDLGGERGEFARNDAEENTCRNIHANTW